MEANSRSPATGEQDLDLQILEEETLDSLAGAELGEVVRDAHLNQRPASAHWRAGCGGLTEEVGMTLEVEYGEVELPDEEER